MLVAVLAVGTIGSLSMLQDSAEAQIESTATQIGMPRSQITTTTAPGPSGGGGAPTSTVPPTTVPPTTAPPTTAPPTTAPPTTAPPTTAQPSATTVGSSWSNQRGVQSGNQWYAEATLTVRDDLGSPVGSAKVRLVIESRTNNGGWTQLVAPFEVTTTATGALSVTTPNVARTGGNHVVEIRITVQSIDATGLNWNPQNAQVGIGRP